MKKVTSCTYKKNNNFLKFFWSPNCKISNVTCFHTHLQNARAKASFQIIRLLDYKIISYIKCFMDYKLIEGQGHVNE
jgi:hypothetical protein